MKKTIILFSIIVLLFNLQASGQDVAPALTPLINGSGTTYGSLKKIPKPCATAVGNFYVSTADDHNGILCYPGGQTTTTYYDGLTNTKNWISQIYGLSFSSMPTGISTYSTIMTPNSAPAVCFRKNYGSTGALVPGTTLANMWYLPSHMELFLIYQYVAASSSAFTGGFNGTYWSSSVGSNFTAYVVNFPQGTNYFAGSNGIYKVRCVRQ